MAVLGNSLHAADTRSERLWLPASASNLRPFLQMAVDLALEDPNCKDILYARLNEYRTIYDEPTFTILCQKDPKTTFNRVIKITEADPEYYEKIKASEQAQDTNRTLSDELEALRKQLLPPPTASPPPPAAIQPQVQAEPAVEPEPAPIPTPAH